jgi:glycosyltransferase involved in cell wall biosynthesis
MREADARGYRQILVSFVEEMAAPAPELLAICERVVLVKRRGSHYRKDTRLPDVVTEFESAAFAAALDRIAVETPPDLWQFEFTQMAQYARPGQRNLLVEHDITLDLYQQLADHGGDDEVREQLARWREFEIAAWGRFERVIVMSERDRLTVSARSSNAVALPNGVDLERFQPCVDPPEPRRVFFLGSFNHLPNLMAIGWFVREVWPKVAGPKRLHIIAGKRHDYYLDFYRDKVKADLGGEDIEVEGFVADVRPAYRRAAVVIAPLLASAGTNIKVLEAMAMGKAVVSTAAGVHGLDLAAGEDFVLAESPAEFAAAIERLFEDRAAVERQARRTVESRYGWDAIARLQDQMYQQVLSN